MGLGLSIENAQGWKSQYLTMMRWYARCEAVHKDGCYNDFREAVDFVLAFFIACHSLRDWMDKRCDAYMPPSTYPSCMNMCRDVANRAKHSALKSYSRDPNWSMVREYDHYKEGARLKFVFDDLKTGNPDDPLVVIEVLSLIRECVDFWKVSLSDQGLI